MIGAAGSSEAPAIPLSNGACGARIANGIQQLRGMRWWAAAGAFRIVNRTGRSVVVRSKYKDVWEGEQWRLAEGGEMVVPPHILKDGEPYSRLGAVIDEDPAGPTGFLKKSVCPPLYIGSQHFVTSHDITLTFSASPSPHLSMLFCN